MAGLPENVRNTLLVGGHVVNEITTLHRLLLFTMRRWPDSVEDEYAAVHYLTIIRLLIGKVAEGLELFQKRVLATPFGRTYRPLVERHPEGKQFVVRLTRLVGGGGLLRRLRNAHAFHNPTDQRLNEAFAGLEATENWSMLAGASRHTILFPMSQAVVTRALIDETEIADARQAVRAIRDDVLDAADALIGFFEYLTIAIADEHELFLGQAKPVKDTSLLPVATEVKIPPLCRDAPTGKRTTTSRTRNKG